MGSSFGGAVKLTGEAEYRKALTQISQNLKEVSSQMKLVDSVYDKNDKSTNALTSKSKVLTSALEQQKSKLSTLQSQYSSMEKQYSSNLTKHNSLVKSYEDEKTKLETIGRSLGTTSKEYQAQADKVLQLEKDVRKSSNAIDQNEKSMSNMRIAMTNAQADINKTSKELDNLGKEAEESGEQAKKGGDGFTIFKGIIANLGSQAIMGAINGLKSLGNAFINLGKQAVESYAEYEQLVGGVETLFKDSAPVVQKYANDAYKTAGLSANEYMETVTSFSASLISSLDGDTQKAAEYSNRAITDMSDNANKMGTDIGMLQNAYQGFAKQNYTMLDNLKLGYGGTKEEMARLISEASQMTDVQEKLNIAVNDGDMSFGNIVNAISVVQSKMGIMGTTANEASTTIQGSVNAMKSSWGNLITGIANDNADFGQLVNNFTESTITALQNLLPRIKIVVGGIGQLFNSLVEEVLPQILEQVPPLLEGLLPTLLNSLGTLGEALLSAIEQLLPLVSEMIPKLVEMIVQLLPQLIDVGIKAILSLIQGIVDALPTLIEMLPTIIMQIVDVLVNNLPLIIDAGIQVIFALVDGLIEALPTLIDYIPEIIDKIVVAVTENLPKIIEAGITLIIKLAEGLIKALPQLISKIPQIMGSLINGIINYYGNLLEIGKNLISKMVSGIGSMIGNVASKVGEVGLSIVNGFIQLPQKMLDIGKNIVEGLWNGISNMTSWVIGKIQSFGDSVLGGIKSFFGIASPSKLFKNEVGKYLAEGIGVGFTDEMKDVTKDMQNAIPTSFDTSINGSYGDLKGTSDINPSYSFSTLVDAFKTALGEMKIELDDDEMGKFIDKTVARTIYS